MLKSGSMLGGFGKKLPAEKTAITSDTTSAESVVERFKHLAQDHDAKILRCDQIVVRKQARESFDPEKLKTLAENIAARGQLQPIVVWQNEQGELELIAGERRLRAIRDILKRKEIRAYIPATEIERDAIEAAQLSENLHREPYQVVELARAYQRLKKSNNLTNAQLGKWIAGISEAQVSKILSVLDAPKDVLAAIENETLPPTTFFNNKALFKNGLPEGFRNTEGEGRAKRGRNKIGEKTISTVSIAEDAARALFDIMQEMAKRLKMKPIEPMGDLNKRELQGLLNKHAVSVGRKLRT